mmetsp:Transcript_13793/g.15870  ORF Transcript_13793/g.15870 Transcript_13793/m.15870 type:complete len:97 (+) Transcript_13793:126-416(+)
MYLAVFHEFRSQEILDKVAAIPLAVDKAESPCSLAKSESELETVATNAKLMFDASTDPEVIDSVLINLTNLGFQIVNRHPVTSAGCAMRDRVILKL